MKVKHKPSTSKKKLTKVNKVKTILISQPAPENGKSPYDALVQKFKVKVDFRPFVHVEGIPAKEFRKTRIALLDYTAVILTSKVAIDHFFRICEELRLRMPDSTKYYCSSESVALYLQKYTQYRKRKVSFGSGGTQSLMELIKKSKTKEKWLYPCADVRTSTITDFLTEQENEYAEAVIYKTVCSDLSDLKDIYYDMIVFFSTSGIKSLYQNFPDFEQKNTRIAAFGPKTTKTLEDAGLVVNVQAPNGEFRSMSSAMENYIKAANK